MKKDIIRVTSIPKYAEFFKDCAIIEVKGLDNDAETYDSITRVNEPLDKLLKNLRDGNKYGIQIADMKRKGDRNHCARYYQIPYSFIIETCNYGDAREMGLNDQNFSIYRQKDGQGYLLFNGGGATAIIERLYVIKHEIMDNTLPFYYTRAGQPCSNLSLANDMFFSSSKQAMDKQAHIYDGCTHIETIFADYRFDPRNLLEV